MHDLVSGDRDNSQIKSILLSYPDKTDNFLRPFFAGNFNIQDTLLYILSGDKLSDVNYKNYCIMLTLGDMLPEPIQKYEAQVYFFALQVNYNCAIGRSRGKINSYYLAAQIMEACEGDYQKFSGSIYDDFYTEYINIPVKFDCLLNTITLKLPISKISKGIFKQKDIGFMLQPSMEAPGYFMVENDKSGLMEYKISKTLYADLFIDAQCHNGSYMFNDNNKAYLASMINVHDSNKVYEILYSQDIYSVYNFEINDQYWLDDNYLFNIYTRYAPEVREEDQHDIIWEEVRPFQYRLKCHHKPYIVCIVGSTCYIMTD